MTRGVRLLIMSALVSVIPAMAMASSPSPTSAAQRQSTESTAATDIFDLDMDENISTPKVGGKQHEAIKDYMRSVATSFYKKGYKVETMRGGEVVIITIPTDEMFQPNDSALIQSASGLLKPLVPYVNDNGKFKTLIAIHSDDTGSEAHQQQLTEGRITAVYDWFDNNARDSSQLVGYPMGGGDPIAPNNSRLNRHANRRMEVYLIPEKGLIQLAKSGKL